MPKLTAELMQMLDGFEQRMRFVRIAKSLTNYSKPDIVRQAVGDSDALDNLVVAVFVFIMERTLRYETVCGIKDIADFVRVFSPQLGIDSVHAPLLARHIVVTVLQNEGQPQEFQVWDSREETLHSVTLRLISEEKGNYHLTDDACEFLFRTKEIDSELDFSVARFRLNELLKRENYNDATAQSRELIIRIRGMCSSMEDFLFRCRENMGSVTVDAYESIVMQIRNLLEQEEGELELIQSSAQERLKLLNADALNGQESETAEKARRALHEIIKNVEMTIQEQRRLINRRSNMSEQYRQLLRDSFTMQSFKRYKPRDELLKPFWNSDCDFGKIEGFASFLLTPLCKPQWNSFFSLESFYAPQRRLGAENIQEEIDIAPQEDPAQVMRDRRDARHLAIIRNLFCYMKQHTRFTTQEYVKQLPLGELLEECEENALPQVMLTLYEMGTISVEKWKQSDAAVFAPAGEFELPWIFTQLSDEELLIREINVFNQEKTFSFEMKNETQEQKITLTDFIFEVIS